MTSFTKAASILLHGSARHARSFPTSPSRLLHNTSAITFQKPKLNYIFAHAATGFPKTGKKITISPEEDTRYLSVQVGEDSYFRRYDALGVADGVGGWSHSATAGKFSTLPMRVL